ncbi:hypothetical protein JL720_12424 [Aureococcus anophagefferens]|nr:hypothetical protein JL720_12424 [Aureococcus anophagefferens]
MLASLSPDKKRQMIAMHTAMASLATPYGAADEALLKQIRDADLVSRDYANATITGRAFARGAVPGDGGPDAVVAAHLQTLYAAARTANRSWLDGFVGAGGVELLTGARRLERDVVSGGRPLANTGLRPAALEILSVVAWASDDAPPCLVDALCRRSALLCERPFEWARRALACGSLATRSYAMTLCNQLVMRTADVRSRRALRDAMRRAGVEDAAAKALDRAAAAFGGDESGDDDGYDEDLAGWLPLDAAGGVEPLRAACAASCGRRSGSTRARRSSLLGSDRGVKSRSYCLDAGLLTWEGGRTLDESKFVRIDDVQAVRSCSDNAGINAVARLAVELVFEPPRPPLVLGTDDDRAHSAWVVALRVAKRTAAADATALTAAGAPPGSPARRRKRRKSAVGRGADGATEP